VAFRFDLKSCFSQPKQKRRLTHPPSIAGKDLNLPPPPRKNVWVMSLFSICSQLCSQTDASFLERTQ
jgi:hypothetical protein